MSSNSMISDLRAQAAAVLVMLSLAVIAVLALVVLEEFRDVVATSIGADWQTDQAQFVLFNTTIHATITAFVAAFALFGTFAVVTALIIVVKGIVGVVKGLQ